MVDEQKGRLKEETGTPGVSLIQNNVILGSQKRNLNRSAVVHVYLVSVSLLPIEIGKDVCPSFLLP